MTPTPLILRPMLYPKVWGGDRLARFGKNVKPGDTVGESWEVADLAGTSASGAGGGAARSVIDNGPLAGKTLHDAVTRWPRELTGDPRASSFPLLVKYLDAREDLSVQVHPSPSYAASHADAHLKTECWYILDAARDTWIYKGVKPGVTRERFERALRDNSGPSIVGLLEAVPAVPGECHNLPSGTVHALGAGVLVAEVQTPSDTTFRVYDWGRTGRELHIDQALDCIAFEPAPPATRSAASGSARLVTNDFFTLDAWRLDRSGHAALPPGPHILMLLRGEATLSHAGSALSLRSGQTIVIPASDPGAGASGPRLAASGPVEALVACPVSRNEASSTRK